MHTDQIRAFAQLEMRNVVTVDATMQHDLSSLDTRAHHGRKPTQRETHQERPR